MAIDFPSDFPLHSPLVWPEIHLRFRIVCLYLFVTYFQPTFNNMFCVSSAPESGSVADFESESESESCANISRKKDPTPRGSDANYKD